MTKYFGMEATITEKDEFENYKIDIDNGKFTWAAYLFENTELDSDEKLIISQDLIKDIAELIKKYNLGASVRESEGKLILPIFM